jgi:hypothetical protein
MTINAQVARRLGEVADLVQEQNVNPFGVQAYRRVQGQCGEFPHGFSPGRRMKGESVNRPIPGQ